MSAEGPPPVGVYQFEEIGADLARPPFAALRALQSVGILATPRGWLQLDQEARRTLTEEGQRERIDILVVRTIANGIPANQLKLVSRAVDPPVNDVPVDLQRALGPQRAIPLAEWQALSSLDRFVLASLAYNTRLLWRALDELEHKQKLQRRRGAWAGAVARCELRMRPDVLVQIMGAQFLEGRALVLARGAGRRAARKASETFDLQSETETGPIELDWSVLDQPGAMLWQAHVSGWDGAFLPAASLQAAITAAVAIYDMIKELDPKAALSLATIAEEPWLVGSDGPADIATRLYARPPKALAPPVPEPPPSAPPSPAKVPAAPAPRASAAKLGETVRLNSPLVPPVTPSPSPQAAPPAAPTPASSPRPARASSAQATPKTSAPPDGRHEQTLQLPRLKQDNKPLVAIIVAVSLAGAGLLGYMLGR